MDTIKRIEADIYFNAKSLFEKQAPNFASENFNTYIYNGLKKMEVAGVFTKEEIKEVKRYADKVHAEFVNKAHEKLRRYERDIFKF